MNQVLKFRQHPICSTTQLLAVAKFFLSVCIVSVTLAVWWINILEPLNQKELRNRELDVQIQQKENRIIQLRNDSVQRELQQQVRLVQRDKELYYKKMQLAEELLVKLTAEKDREIKALRKYTYREVPYKDLDSSSKALVDLFGSLQVEKD